MDTKKLTEPADGEPEIDPKSLVPLPRLAFQVLLALARSDNHGYAIAKAVRAKSAGRVRLATGPMYRHLKRLLDEGLIEENRRSCCKSACRHRDV